MNPAILSLIALLIAIALSMATKLNVGVAAMAFAWLIGTYAAGWKAEQVAAGFPSSLFLTLTGVTLLFALAETNGTLDRLAQRAIGLARGQARLLPVLLFVAAFALSSVGPGAVIAVALLIPMAMPAATRAGVPRFLTALAVANGANAGNLSPISAIGIIANTKMAEAGIGGHEAKVWIANFVAHLLVMAAAYVLLGGWRLPSVPHDTCGSAAPAFERAPLADGRGDRRVDRRRDRPSAERRPGGVPGRVHLGADGARRRDGGDEARAVGRDRDGLRRHGADRRAREDRRDGAVHGDAGAAGDAGDAERHGGVRHRADLELEQHQRRRAARRSCRRCRAWSQKVGGGDPLAVALSINVGSAMVDVSPLSTLGALCVATVADPAEARTLFRQLLLWGLSMSVVGALLCQLLAGVMARA